MSTTAPPGTQLDLFEVLSAEQRRYRDALVCMRDAVPEALEAVVELRYWRPKDTRAPHASGAWAYCLCKAGLRYEATRDWWAGARARGETWGWDRTPAHLVTWDELTGLVGADPRRAEIAAWAAGVPEPRWRTLWRPHELGPDPGGWNLRYLCRDHVNVEWTGRRRAWQLVLDVLTDAITAVTARVGDAR